MIVYVATLIADYDLLLDDVENACEQAIDPELFLDLDCDMCQIKAETALWEEWKADNPDIGFPLASRHVQLEGDGVRLEYRDGNDELQATIVVRQFDTDK